MGRAAAVLNPSRVQAVLRLFDGAESLRVQEVAELLSVSYSNAQVWLRDLHQAHLLQYDGKDRGRLLYALAPKGQRVLDGTEPAEVLPAAPALNRSAKYAGITGFALELLELFARGRTLMRAEVAEALKVAGPTAGKRLERASDAKFLTAFGDGRYVITADGRRKYEEARAALDSGATTLPSEEPESVAAQPSEVEQERWRRLAHVACPSCAGEGFVWHGRGVGLTKQQCECTRKLNASVARHVRVAHYAESRRYEAA